MTTQEQIDETIRTISDYARSGNLANHRKAVTLLQNMLDSVRKAGLEEAGAALIRAADNEPALEGSYSKTWLKAWIIQHIPLGNKPE